MILMYHKIDIIVPTMWWVSADAFARQMDALSGKNIVPLADYRPGDPSQCVITFDDAYENVYRHAFPVLREKGYPFEIFVNGDLLGKWNAFDRSEPLTRFCGIEQLREMASTGGRIQWHGRSHANLSTLDIQAVDREISIPDSLRREFPTPHLDWFAYPYGAHTPAIVARVSEVFDGALSVCDGSATDRYQFNRIVMTETRMPGSSEM